jgi:hypothetical protein
MKLTIAESFYILIHHPEKPRIVVTEAVRNAGMIGAIFLDLSVDGNLSIENGLIRVKSLKTKLPPAHVEVLNKITDSTKLRKPKSWISRFTQTAGKTKRSLVEELEKKGLLEVEHKRFLFIPYIRTWLSKPEKRENLIQDLRAIVFRDKEFDGQYASLLGLVQACKIHKLISTNRDELKSSKARIKEIIESDLITQGVGTVIQEMQAAMMTAIIASTAATTASTAASH